eukprot:GHVS01075876.1.p1 GENE.GHVS01075876.1~~GHVS01075876.1.p1  ORF type:complete len:533 (+),score=126.77 GHVS01075876.1:232-1830(+)
MAEELTSTMLPRRTAISTSPTPRTSGTLCVICGSSGHCSHGTVCIGNNGSVFDATSDRSCCDTSGSRCDATSGSSCDATSGSRYGGTSGSSCGDGGGNAKYSRLLFPSTMHLTFTPSLLLLLFLISPFSGSALPFTEHSASSAQFVMPMYFTTTSNNKVQLLVNSWTTSTSFDYALTLLACVGLGVLSVAMKKARRYMEDWMRRREDDGEAMVLVGSCWRRRSEGHQLAKETRRFRCRRRILWLGGSGVGLKGDNNNNKQEFDVGDRVREGDETPRGDAHENQAASDGCSNVGESATTQSGLPTTTATTDKNMVGKQSTSHEYCRSDCYWFIRLIVGDGNEAEEGFPLMHNICRMFASFCVYSLDYLLMLIVMTYNYSVFFCTMFGLSVGFLFLGHLPHEKSPEKEQTDNTDVVVVGPDLVDVISAARKQSPCCLDAKVEGDRTDNNIQLMQKQQQRKEQQRRQEEKKVGQEPTDKTIRDDSKVVEISQRFFGAGCGKVLGCGCENDSGCGCQYGGKCCCPGKAITPVIRRA